VVSKVVSCFVMLAVGVILKLFLGVLTALVQCLWLTAVDNLPLGHPIVGFILCKRA
jgi:hypothetical protein